MKFIFILVKSVGTEFECWWEHWTLFHSKFQDISWHISVEMVSWRARYLAWRNYSLVHQNSIGNTTVYDSPAEEAALWSLETRVRELIQTLPVKRMGLFLGSLDKCPLEGSLFPTNSVISKRKERKSTWYMPQVNCLCPPGLNPSRQSRKWEIASLFLLLNIQVQEGVLKLALPREVPDQARY